MKRIAICMDGTWSRLRMPHPTNIAKLARSVEHEGADGAKQIVIYAAGVGAASELEASAAGALAGGLFGAGLERDILDTYVRLCLNYQWGDEIYIFGYSRGAFSARSLAGLIRRCGVVRRRHVDRAPEAFQLYRNGKGRDADDPVYVAFREAYGKSLKHGAGPMPPWTIRYIGVFDTVGQRGVPSGLGPLTSWINRKFEFHSTTLSPLTLSARHAVAIDEARFAFPPTLWSNLDELNAPHVEAGVSVHDLPYQQRWFPGSHGDIGGGAEGAALANFPLAWIAEGAARLGLGFDRTPGGPLGDALADSALDPAAPFVARPGFLKPRTILKLPKKTKQFGLAETLAHIHPVTALRVAKSNGAYKARPLKPFKAALEDVAAGIAAVGEAAAFVSAKP